MMVLEGLRARLEHQVLEVLRALGARRVAEPWMILIPVEMSPIRRVPTHTPALPLLKMVWSKTVVEAAG